MSNQTNRSIVIDARVKTTLEGMNEVVSKLNQGLRDGTTKIDLTKGVGNSLSKQLDKFKDEYSRFSKYIEGNKIEFADSKDAIKSGETLIRTFKEMRRIIGDFDDLTVIDAKKLFPDAFDSKVSDLLKGLNGLSTAMTKLESKQLDLSTAQNEMGELTREAQKFQSLIDQEATLKLELEKARADLEHFDSEIEAIRAKAAKGISLKINTATTARDEAKKKIEEIETTRNARGFNQEDFSGSTARAVKFKGKTEKQWTDESTKKDASEASKAEATAALEAIRIYRQEENALKDLNAMLQARKKEIDSLRESLSNINNMKVSQAVEIAGGTTEEINEANAAMQVHAEAAKEAAAARGRYNTAVQQAKGASDKIEKTNAALEAQQAKIDKITLEIGELNKEVSTEALEEAFSTAGVEDFNTSMLKSKEGVEELKTKLNQLDEERLVNLKKALGDIGLGADKAEDYVEQLRGTLTGVRESADDIKRSASEMENLKNQVLHFFSLTNSVQLFKRAVSKAMNTVRELDATMTEAAVVTDFDIGDMWNKLPQYTTQAQKLGVSINGMYQATTLYYQQGLKNNEAMALGVETMKMAKIAGLETVDATKAMTAALRGFNMELNETSATKVNDVYSQLAAVTAADVGQISTAMEKTASIAASANMEFETTAALLAQIIETTQEAPETAGTAMKTIIARFSEVKSLKNRGELSGKDSEGEDIDVNKIQTALRSVGISMTGFFEGTEGLDSVLLKLAEKWGSLDFETQRYIATMAAGSRQQSRFIAMMSDYARTTELVSEAQNSAGASQKQFEKTLDSMDSKIQKLDNAWNEFLMGLANNEILKGAIDLITNLVTGINELVNTLSHGSGTIKSVFSLLTVVGGLSAGKAAFSGGLGWVGRQMGLTPQQSEKQPGSFARATEARLAAKKEGKNGFWAGTKAFYTNNNPASAKIIKEARKTVANRDYVSREKLMGVGTAADFKKSLGDQKDSSAATAAMKKYDEALRMNANNQDKLSIAAKAATEEFEKQGGKTSDLVVEQIEAGKTSRLLSFNFRNLGMTITGVGAAAGALAGLLSALGFDEAAEEVGKLSGIIMGVGVLISTLGPLFQTAGSKIMAAGIKAQLGWWWVVIIIAAIAVLVGVIALLITKSKSAEEKMAELDSQMSALADSAKEAEEAMERLAETQQKLAKLQTTIKGLTKGTSEWQKALIESNNMVLELLETYPELSGYISTDNDGMLVIDEEGWQTVSKKQLEVFANTSAARAALGVQKAQLTYEMAGEEKNDNIRQAQQLSAETQGNLQTEAFYSQLVSSNIDLANSQYGLMAANLLAAEGMQVFSARLDSVESSIDAKENKASGDALKKEYAGIMGMDVSEVEAQLKDKTLSWDLVKKTVAANRVAKNALDEIKVINTAISKSSHRDLLSKMFSKEGKNMKSQDVTALKELIFKDKDKDDLLELQEFLHSQGINLAPSQLEALLTTFQTVDGTLTNLNTTLQDLQLSEDFQNFLKDQDYGIANGISSKIADLQAQGKSVEEINALFDTLLQTISTSDLSQEEQTKLWEQLAIADWSSLEDLDSVFGAWGTKLNLDLDVLNSLKNQMVDLTDAVSDNTVAQNQQKAFQGRDIINSILSGELSNVMTTQQKQSLLDTGNYTEDEFQQTGTDQWVYKGDLYSKTLTVYAETANAQITGDIVVDAKQEADKGEKLTNLINDKYADGDYTVTVAESTLIGSFEQANALGSEITDYGWVTGSEFSAVEGQKGPDLSFDTYMKGRFGQDIDMNLFNDVQLNQYKQDYVKAMQAWSDSFSRTKTFQGLSWDSMLNTIQSGGTIDEPLLDQLGTDMATVLGETFDTTMTVLEKQQWILGRYSTYVTGLDTLNANKDAAIAQQGAGIGSHHGLTSSYGYVGGQLTGADRTAYAYNYGQGINTRYTLYGGETFYDNITEDLVEEGIEDVTKYDRLIKALASDVGYVTKKIKTFAENVSSLSENLNENKRGTIEYNEALNVMYSNIGDMFGKDAKWAKNLNLSEELLEGIAAGDTKSLETFESILADYTRNGLMNGLAEFSLLANATLNNQPLDMQAQLEMLISDNPEERAAAKARITEWLNSLGDDAQAAASQFAWLAMLNGTVVTFDWNEDGTVGTFDVENFDLSSLFGNYYGGGSSGGGGGSSNEWENPYDKLHNTLEQINDTIREREKLERRYQKLLDRQLLTLKEAKNLYNQTMGAYQNEAELQRRIISDRYQQIEDEIAANPSMGKYVQVVDDGYGGKTIRIDWDALEQKDGKDWAKGEDVTAYYDAIKEWLESIYEAESTLDDIADGMWELINQGKDEYLDLEEQIIDALANERQEEIDKLSEINDSINDTNSRLLDSMQQQIDDYRQERDNQETEEEISDKQRRLAYLQQDTSGANALEIMQLQEEIDEAQEDYTDTLIDQKISELQQQNDEAAEQRQRQIDIMQAQLDYDKETGAFNDKAEALIDEVRANGGVLSGTKLENLLKNDQNWQGMSKLGKVDWLDNLTQLLVEALDYREKQTSIKDLMDANKLQEGGKVTFTTADGKTVTGTVQADGKIKDDATGQTYSNVTRDWLGNYSTTENYQTAPPPGSKPPASEPEPPKVTTNDKKGVSAAIWNGGQGWGKGATRAGRLKEVFGEDNDIQKNYVDKRIMSGYTGKVSDYSYDKMKKKFVAYKTGGLADFTGPAWLDGTKSKPEYILNADQTEAFFQLVDVLSSLQAKPTQTTQNNGDNTFDIDINVESIGNDYDVEQLAETVKRLINEDARYRNNNAINLMR